MSKRCRVLFLKSRGLASWLYRFRSHTPWDDVAFEYDDDVYWIARTGTVVMIDRPKFERVYDLKIQISTQTVSSPVALAGYLNLRRTKQGQCPTGKRNWTQSNVEFVHDALNLANPGMYGDSSPESILELWERLPNLAHITQR